MDDPEELGELADLIERLSTAPDGKSFSGIEPLILRRKGKCPIIVSVLNVPEAERGRFLGARALLALVPVGSKSRPDTVLLTRAFNFTPAEAKLAAALAGGLSLEEAAEELRITRDTARNQLKGVFRKTGTHRQSQLVALLARL